MKIMIVGGGELGRQLAIAFSRRGHDVVVVEKDPKKCEALSTEVDALILNRDAVDPNLYDEIDLATFDVLIAATDKDEVNLFVAAVAREYGVPRVFVVTRTEKASQLIQRLGLAEEVLSSPVTIAKLAISMIEGKYSVHMVLPILQGNFGIFAITLSKGDRAVGMRLKDLEIPERVKVLAIFDGKEFLDPDPDLVLQSDWVIIFLATKEDAEKLEREILR